MYLVIQHGLCQSKKILAGLFRQSYIILNQTICKNKSKNTQDIYNKTIPGPDTLQGAPARSHISYGCQMQNNFPYKDDKYLR